MTPYVAVLASGSSANAALVHTGRHGLLIDCGLDPRSLGYRLKAVGATWADISAVVLTHTHGDHWKRQTLTTLLRYQIPVYAHPAHHEYLDGTSVEHPMLAKRGLVREFAAGAAFDPVPGLTATPVPVPHDCEPTFAFRLDAAGWAVGYASDVGRPTPELTAAFAGADVLCVEFNHDVRMQQASRRPANLIARVLGPNGHLSNEQGAAVCRAVRQASPPGRVQAVVQLHLSRECNRADLARAAAAEFVTDRCGLWTATQDIPCGPVRLNPRADTGPAPRPAVQPALPGMG
jgi:phosphoribosyl 1,2-cyclic phosphodiesterase